MTYELAKKLKDAGFPQSSKDFLCQHKDHEGMASRADCVYAAVPKTTQLASACGKNLEVICKNGKKWEAGISGVGTSDDILVQERDERLGVKGKGIGRTIEEALVELWLAIEMRRRERT